MKLRALAVLQIAQIALQLSVQIGLPLQVGLEQGAGLRQLQGERERSNRVTPRLDSSLARYWLR